jgi:biotin-dependent carboxylase-like uncharacterized protein
MTRMLEILAAHPGMSVQDAGRPGLLAHGVSAGGALDPLALAEGAALLGEPVEAAIEMPGLGGTFRLVGGGAVIALTGAPMQAQVDGTPLVWPGSHAVPEGAVLTIGAATRGLCGYLSVGGGLDAPRVLGARGAHLAAGIGAPLAAGQTIPLGQRPATARAPGFTLTPRDRFSGGDLRVLPGVQTRAFGAAQLARFEQETFVKDARANRQGARLAPEGEGFAADGGLSVTSEAIVPGDIQVVAGGAPFVLLAESQTTGGYPRIGTVISADLSRVAQAPPGTTFRFAFVTLEQALAARAEAASHAAALSRQVTPLVRDPRQIPDLLAYRLVDGVTSARDHHDEEG